MSSTGADSRALTPLVVMDALTRAGTVVCEPMHRFDLEVPIDVVGSVLSAITRLEPRRCRPTSIGSRVSPGSAARSGSSRRSGTDSRRYGYVRAARRVTIRVRTSASSGTDHVSATLTRFSVSSSTNTAVARAT